MAKIRASRWCSSKTAAFFLLCHCSHPPHCDPALSVIPMQRRNPRHTSTTSISYLSCSRFHLSREPCCDPALCKLPAPTAPCCLQTIPPYWLQPRRAPRHRQHRCLILHGCVSSPPLLPHLLPDIVIPSRLSTPNPPIQPFPLPDAMTAGGPNGGIGGIVGDVSRQMNSARACGRLAFTHYARLQKPGDGPANESRSILLELCLATARPVRVPSSVPAHDKPETCQAQPHPVSPPQAVRR